MTEGRDMLALGISLSSLVLRILYSLYRGIYVKSCKEIQIDLGISVTVKVSTVFISSL